MKNIGITIVVIIVIVAGCAYYLLSRPLPVVPSGGACQTNNDCSSLNCKGVGAWYCDRDGFPICGTDKVCTCALTCI